MAELEPVISATAAAIWRGLEINNNRHDDHPRLSASSLGNLCDRALWYDFRWVQFAETFDGRKLSIFETGEVWEERLVAFLRNAGMEVDALDPETGEQHRVVFAAGHASGRTDGKVRGVPEAPKTEHVLECKSHNNRSFGEVKRKGVREGKPAHYAQMQTYMHHQGLSRALYVAVNKNDDDLYIERVEYDATTALNLVAKAERISRAEVAPAKLHEDPEAKAAWQCRFCRHRPVCHDGAFARRTCRSCLHSTAEMDGDGRWSCARHKIESLSHEAQRTGCPNHLYLPSLVPGEQVDADEAAETITYRMADGQTWVDGGRPS
jgi:hypothetical protein